MKRSITIIILLLFFKMSFAQDENITTTPPNEFVRYAQMNDTIAMDSMFHLGMDINEKYVFEKQAIHYAASSGSLESVIYLINHGAEYENVDDLSCDVIELACRSGNLDMVIYLHDTIGLPLQREISNEPINFAACKGHLDIVKYIISKGDNPLETNQRQSSVFMDACYSKNIELVKYLHETYEFDVNMVDNINDFPLMEAIGCDNNEVTYYLLQNGATTNRYKSGGRFSPIDIASICDNIELIDSLLKYGANPYLRGKDGENTFDMNLDKEIKKHLKKKTKMYKADAVPKEKIKKNGYVETEYDGYYIMGKGKMRKGEKHGMWSFYFKNGLIESKGNFNKGKMDGIWEFYYYPYIEPFETISNDDEIEVYINVIKYIDGMQGETIKWEW